MIYQILFTIIIACTAFSILLAEGFLSLSTKTYIKMQQVSLGTVCIAFLGVLLTFVWRA